VGAVRQWVRRSFVPRAVISAVFMVIVGAALLADGQVIAAVLLGVLAVVPVGAAIAVRRTREVMR